MPKEIKLPQWGMNMNDGTVVKWLKSIGEDVSKGDDLVEIESTKVNAAVEATEAGKLGRIDIKEGDLVPVGTVLGMILLEGESESDIPDKLIDNKEENNEIKPKENINLNKKVIASPRARSLAKKLEIDISDLLGTGPSGRITEEDVRLFSENLNISDKTIYSIKESIPSTGIRQIIAKRMFESAQNPQVTLNTVACVDSLFELQKP